ncbi:coniferyl-alcohol dehydrogenase [Roseibium album]|uniref:coniferyl-alcohol dehydrogenase n=1 Tax=Roseibium album TaxID=311410 RepID=UPI000D562ABE|nr:NAD(P)-dependent dehydrogenase (short-subunit alcohol dehydrogenase family) [Labrenzia sp. EL_162]MBG6197405.1 NAD(P)-dependent dehydrogenase (short-subunit alcohol dehydrogenase family) [Labrenzia sp. EL_159]
MNNGKTFIVTGAASGIGAETCRLLKEQGATVIGVDRDPTGNADRFFEADLGDPASIDTLVAELPEGADGLANIAGVPPTRAAEAVLKVNFYGLQRLTLAIVPKLADGASIANLASLAGFGWPNAVDQVKRAMKVSLDDDVAGFCRAEGLDNAEGGRSYFLSKEALIVWTMQNRWAWRDRNITMNCISPGPVDTPILGDFLQTLGERAKEDRKHMDRPGRPQDVAPVVAFALSEHAKWFRGANLTVDGGMSGHILSNIHQF